MDASDYHWFLVSRVTPEQLKAANQGVATRLSQLYMALLVLATVGAWFFAKSHQASVSARLAQNNMADRLAASNRDLEEFAYVASHDLQEPLRKVIAFGDRLETKYADSLGDKGKDYIARMRSATHRMQTLINDLLTFSRVTTKAQPFAPVDLTEITKGVLSDLETRITEVQGKIEIGELPTIEADSMQMRQLLQNLIGNALKFHKPQESPTVTIYSRLMSPHDSNLNSGVSTTSTEIVVQDNGIGFEPKYAEQIFGTFQRLHGRSKYEGTGIGLSICRKIVERHGGTIKAKGELDRGAKFIISLPVKQQKEIIHATP